VETTNTSIVMGSNYGQYSWDPQGPIGSQKDAVVYVLSAQNMPITESMLFTAYLSVPISGDYTYAYNDGNTSQTGTGTITTTALVEKSFNPPTLYGDPTNNPRTLTITDYDIQLWLKEYFFAEVITIIIENNGVLVVPPEPAPPADNVNLRVYFHPNDKLIQKLIFVEVAVADLPGRFGFSQDDYDACTGTSSSAANPHARTNIGWKDARGDLYPRLPIKYTGHSGRSWAPGSTKDRIKQADFYKHANVVGYNTFERSFSSTKVNRIEDVTLPMPKAGFGWFVYFVTSNDWVIGYTNPGKNAPNQTQNKLFWVNPHALRDGGFEMYVSNTVPNGSSGNSTTMIQGSKTPFSNHTLAIPIGHSQLTDLSSIMKFNTHTANSGTIRHDAN
jgi:hypothetical protein